MGNSVPLSNSVCNLFANLITVIFKMLNWKQGWCAPQEDGKLYNQDAVWIFKGFKSACCPWLLVQLESWSLPRRWQTQQSRCRINQDHRMGKASRVCKPEFQEEDAMPYAITSAFSCPIDTVPQPDGILIFLVLHRFNIWPWPFDFWAILLL